MTVAGADSSGFHPTLAQLQAAYAQGVRVWGFYLPGPGIYSGDTQADFDHIHQAQMKSIGWASGNADPAQQRALAASWSVDYPTLDCEGSIRGKGSWTQPWLDSSGFGIYLPYGLDGSIFNGMRAPWFIMADYLGAYPYIDPQAAWRGTAPSVPHGWQWAGTVNAFGGAVDRLWLDDWFLGQQPAQGDQDVPIFATTTDPNSANKGKVFLVANPPYGPKRYVSNPAEEAAYAAVMTDATIHTYPGFVIDAMETEDYGEDYGDALAALAAQVATITTGTQGPTGPAGPAGPAVTSVTISGTFPATSK